MLHNIYIHIIFENSVKLNYIIFKQNYDIYSYVVHTLVDMHYHHKTGISFHM